MKDDALMPVIFAFALVVVAATGWQLHQDMVTSNYCQSIGKTWYRSEGFFTLTPVAVCMEASKHSLPSGYTEPSE